MSSSCVRFVHRPIPDETKVTVDGREGMPLEKEPLIDPEGIRRLARTPEANRIGWLRGGFSKLFRAGGRKGY